MRSGYSSSGRSSLGSDAGINDAEVVTPRRQPYVEARVRRASGLSAGNMADAESPVPSPTVDDSILEVDACFGDVGGEARELVPGVCFVGLGWGAGFCDAGVLLD